jgi:hypothetical protein
MLTVARYFEALLSGLNRKPVLTAMMGWSLVFGALVLAADITVSRVNSTCAMVELGPNGAQGVTVRSDLPVHHARNDSAAACPCVTSSRWHWQLI